MKKKEEEENKTHKTKQTDVDNGNTLQIRISMAS